MKLIIILFGFVLVALMVAGLVYVAGTTTYILPIDSYGNAATETTNETASMIEGIANTGLSAGLGLVMIFAVLGVLAGIATVRHYAR